jgi:hypothetical protein
MDRARPALHIGSIWDFGRISRSTLGAQKAASPGIAHYFAKRG